MKALRYPIALREPPHRRDGLDPGCEAFCQPAKRAGVQAVGSVGCMLF